MSMSEPGGVSQSHPTIPVVADRRAWVRVTCGLDGSARPLGEKTDISWQVTMLDISTGGIGLLSSKRFELKTYLMVERHTESAERRRMRLAQVIHVRQAPAESGWIIGCSFASKLREEDLRLWLS